MRLPIRLFAFASLLPICWLSIPYFAATAAGQEKSGRLERVETLTAVVQGPAGTAPTQLSLSELMKLYNIPGLSVAIIENYKVVDAKGYGVIEAGSSTPVTTHTLYQAGSISKPVAATGALSLVEKDKLSLDEDVNVKLKTWKVPENDFTKTEKVTLRRIMSHTAGLTVHGFPGYDADDPRPTLVEVLDGEKPANTAAIRVDTTPGTLWRYSGGGVTIEQLLMMDVTGKQFPALMRELVLDKIGMNDSSYEQPLPATRAAMTAGGTAPDGTKIHGKWHIYPEMAAAGLWTTPTDLAKFAIEIALSKQGKSNRILSQKMTREMLTPVMNDVGLGFFLDKDNPGQFGHGGDDDGFEALLTMNAETGNGIAVMANSNNGIALANHIIEGVVKQYGWSYKPQPEAPWDELLLLTKLKGADAALRRDDELKSKAGVDNEQTLNILGYMLLYGGREADGLRVFQKNVEEYPKSSNVYDSLGEAYMKMGQKDQAIQNYEKSLELNPKNENAVKQLQKLKEGGMGAKVIERDGFTVIGIAARTNNAKEMTADGVIGKQRGRLMQEGLLAKIPNKADQSIVAVYTDYASDHNGDYTFLLGARVKSDSDVPAGMVAKKIPSGKFAVFTTEKGPAQKVVPKTWMTINSLPKTDVGGDRVYQADYEIYDERAADPTNMVADIYVGIR
jgi:CubicO group peptidase (beta-lactamase class C family)/predicted transcriptional regulator YdeE